MGNCPRRIQITVNIEPETEPEPVEPASEREGAASAVDNESDGGFSLVGSEPPQAVLRPQSRPFLRNPARVTFQLVALRLPALQAPSLVELTNPRLRFYVVWEVPGREWAGIHWGQGLLVWRQLRSHAVDSQPALGSEAAFSTIRWHRCIGCSHDQLQAAYRRESGRQELALYFYWR